MYDTIVPVISNVGFPIAMCLYFAFRFEKILKENTKAVQSISQIIELQCMNYNLRK